MKLYRYFKKEDERFAKSFVEKGSIRLMPFLYYRQLEDKKRRDLNDGKHVYHPEGNKDSLLINGRKIDYLPGLKFEIYDKNDEYWAIICFSKSDSLGKFGEICVTIDREEFVNRVKEFFGVSSYPEIVCDDVIYYDPKISHQTTSHSFLYKTKEEFEEEEEFRICINFKEVLRAHQIEKLEVVNINIGSLEDISSILVTKE